MPLIKSAVVPTSLSPFSMANIESQAAGMLSGAQKNAKALVTAAQTESEALKKAAQAQGMAEGLKLGQAQGLEQGKKSGHDQALQEHRAKLTAVVTALTQAAQGFEASRAELESLGLRAVIELAAAIARRVTKRQGMVDPAVLGANLKEAMKLVCHKADVRIAVNPAQMATLKAELPNLQMTWPQMKHVEMTEEAALSPGSCRVYTANGCVDGDLDGQLDRVIEHLLPVNG